MAINGLWQANPKMTPNDPHLLVFIPLCNSLLLSVSATYDLFLINIIWQR